MRVQGDWITPMLLGSSAAVAAVVAVVAATADKADAASTRAATQQVRTAEPKRSMLRAIG